MKCNRYSLRLAISLPIALLTGALWTLVVITPSGSPETEQLLPAAVVSSLLLCACLYWLQKAYQRHVRKVLFLLAAIENNDTTVHFSETEDTADARLVNHALNKVAYILNHVKHETAQQEKYYELILECVNTGILVLNGKGAVYQKNNEALRLLGLNVLTHISQLNRIDPHLASTLANCQSGEKLQIPFNNERGNVNLSVRVSGITVSQEPLRILALNDINNELDEKEIDSWIRLTRVLTHEIMNAVTPITSLSDTLLRLTEEPASKEEMRNGLQTISSTGKGLLSFVESYRKFTHIPVPVPSLFYVKGFIERMVELARHQYPDARIDFHTQTTPDDLILYADENLTAQVVTNLLKNAIQAIEADTESEQEKRIDIRAYCNEQEAVLIEVSNSGPRIPDDIAEHIFIPFFTTKEEGSGVGLSISRQIMRLSGGSISLLPGKQTTFVLTFN